MFAHIFYLLKSYAFFYFTFLGVRYLIFTLLVLFASMRDTVASLVRFYRPRATPTIFFIISESPLVHTAL
jgi:hypothetical protein